MEKNHHSITIIPDEYFYEMLQRIKQRPGMFLGQCSITRLRAFLDGYMGSRSDLGLPPTQQELEFNQFQEWVQRRFKISSSHGWDSIILFYSADERDALNNLRYRFWGCEDAIAQALTCQFAFGDLWDAIAKRCCKQFAVWGCGNAIAKRSVGIAVWGVGERSLFRGLEGAIAVWGVGER